MDLDLRRVRNFVAVAEELHFGRAAQRLHIAQPALSRQIRSLEADLGVTLFDRDRRTTTLTPAGRQLLADAPALLETADAAIRRARAAAASTLTIGFMPGITLTSLTRLVREDHPELQIRLLRTDWDTQITVLRDGRADVSVVRLPVEHDGITIHPWFSEPRVAVIPIAHPCAGARSMALADLAGDHLVQAADAVPEWRAVADEFRSGTPAPAPRHHSVEEKLEAVAAGDGVCVLPASTGHFYTRSDVAVVPIHDIAPNEVALAWPTATPSPWVRSVAVAATRTTPQP